MPPVVGAAAVHERAEEEKASQRDDGARTFVVLLARLELVGPDGQGVLMAEPLVDTGRRLGRH